MSTYTIPSVVERTVRGERAVDIYSRLLTDRIVYIGTEIDDGVANVVIAQLLHLESSAPEREIAIYLNSPGGSFTSLMAIYDTMSFVSAPISTFCVGQAASTAAVLLAAGAGGGAWVYAHRGSPLENGRALQAKGDLRGAQIELRNAIKEEPNNSEAHFRLAQLQLQGGDPIAAERELRAARDLGYDADVVTPLLGQAMLAQGLI